MRLNGSGNCHRCKMCRDAGKSGGGPPHSRTLARFSTAFANAKRLGLRQPAGAFAGNNLPRELNPTTTSNGGGSFAAPEALKINAQPLHAQTHLALGKAELARGGGHVAVAAFKFGHDHFVF